MYDIPILFIIFKRYDTSIKVFQKIRNIKPKKLYIAADAGRTKEEEDKCFRTRSIVDNIDWDCDVKLLFQDKNLGCKYGPYTAINWFFQFEEEGIILEDDCLPNDSFFTYMKEMLHLYKNDNRIGMIAGHNPINIELPYSYIFSRFKGCWGWATWKRAWENIDIELTKLNYIDEIIPLMVYDKKRENHWKHALKLISNNKVAAWDWPWYFSLAAQNQLCVFPHKNLVANIGFGDEGTHCLGNPEMNTLTTYELDFPLVPPKMVAPNLDFDYAFEKDLNMGITTFRKRIMGLIPQSIRYNIKMLLRKIF